jgi:transposase InsO family protein
MGRLDSENMVTGLDTELKGCKECKTHCFACIEGKHSRHPFGVSSRPAKFVLDRIHIDTVGPVSPTAVTGEQYWVTVVDEFTHYVTVIAVKSKDQISEKLIEVFRLWENQLRARIKCVRTDRGTEFLNSRFRSFCAEQGIAHETSAPYTPQQNGVAERMHRTLKEKTSSLLH